MKCFDEEAKKEIKKDKQFIFSLGTNRKEMSVGTWALVFWEWVTNDIASFINNDMYTMCGIQLCNT